MAKSPFKMKGFSGFGNSPLKQDTTSVQDQTRTKKVKPYKLDKKWDREQKEKYFSGHGNPDWSDMNPIHDPTIKKRYRNRDENETLLDIMTDRDAGTQ